MTQAKAMTHTEDLRNRHGAALTYTLQQAATAVADGDFRAAAAAAELLRQWAEHAHTAVVRDALLAGTDWWTLGEHLSLHPQAAWEQYRGVVEGLRPPAEQQPPLAVLCTAGLVAEHDMDAGYGIDLEDLGADHSLMLDPTVVRLRTAAAAVGEDIWITVRLPGRYEGDDDLDDDAAITRWTTVVAHPDELGWLRQALALATDTDVGDEDDDGDDLEPLN